MRHSRRQQNKSAGEGLPCMYSDVVLFFFSFFSQTSAGAEIEKGNYFLFPHPYPLVLAVNNSPAVFAFYHAGSTDFEEKIERL